MHNHRTFVRSPLVRLQPDFRDDFIRSEFNSFCFVGLKIVGARVLFFVCSCMKRRFFSDCALAMNLAHVN